MGLWTDAEDFLDKVETAAEQMLGQPPPVSIIPSLLRGGLPFAPPGGESHRQIFDDIHQLARATRRAIAADCAVFLLDAKPEEHERWMPYLAWARGLGGHHTVVTFNYDVVPEMLAKAREVRMQVIPPGEAGAVAEAVRGAREDNLAPVLKLHGSTNLMVNKKKELVVEDDFRKAIYEPDAEFLMGIPGPAKAQTANGLLKPLWIQARQAIQEADVVAFIGYRFPESDAIARSRLLDVIRANQSPRLRLHTVLGSGNPDAERLQYLLQATVGWTAPIEQLPLYAQDYLDRVWAKSRVIEPPHQGIF
jgi:hypothetical protein